MVGVEWRVSGGSGGEGEWYGDGVTFSVTHGM